MAVKDAAKARLWREFDELRRAALLPYADVELSIATLAGVLLNRADATFDALSATDEEIRERRLPPRPDAGRAPVAFASWTRAMRTKPAYPPVKADPPLFGTGPRGANVMLLASGRRAVTQESSRNWSGAYVRSPSFGPMALVQGRWRVPNTPVFGGGRGFASSVWVGLDGHDPASRLLPQIGTGQLACTFPPSQKHPQGHAVDELTAWWQIWRPGQKVVWQTPIAVPINRGDRIYAQIHVLTPTVLNFFLKNETTNEAYAADYDLTKDGVQSWPERQSFERRTAEWVVERPLSPDREGVAARPIALPFADYGETVFEDCNAAATAAGGTLEEFQLQRARLMRMNVWDDRMRPGRLASRPERVGHDKLRMRAVPAIL